MGKSFNAEVYRKLEQQARENEGELSEAERAAEMSDWYWERLDSEVRYFGGVR
jgi:hypothetical protein